MKKQLLSLLLCLSVIFGAAAPALADDEPAAETPDAAVTAETPDAAPAETPDAAPAEARDLTMLETLELLTYFCNESREEDAILVYYYSEDLNSTAYLEPYAEYAAENGISFYTYDHKLAQLDYFFYVADIYGSVSFPCVLIYNGTTKMMVSDYNVRGLFSIYEMLELVEIEAEEPEESASTMTEEDEARSDRIYEQKSRSKYGEGRTWTEENTYVWNNIYTGDGALTGKGSDAFAMAMSDAAFDKKEKAKDIHHFYFEDVKPGYILRFDGSTNTPHAVVVLDTYSDRVVVAEADLDGSGTIHWGRVLFKDKVLEADALTVRYNPNTEEEPEDGGNVIFADVDYKAYYAPAVAWALENEVTTGSGQNAEGRDLFSPDVVCSRGQVVTFLWRAAGRPEPEAADTEFADLTQDWYQTAVAWAVEQGVTNGTGTDEEGRPLFSPDVPCSGASIITFLFRAVYGVEASVNSEGAPWYYAAYKWVDEHELTAGMDFSLNDDCTRADTVTFLYRYDQLLQSGALDEAPEAETGEAE